MFGLFTESQKEWNISNLCLFWNYHGYSILCFTACIQLVKVSTSAKHRVPRCPEQQKQQKLPQAQWKKFKKNPAHMKSPQA